MINRRIFFQGLFSGASASAIVKPKAEIKPATMEAGPYCGSCGWAMLYRMQKSPSGKRTCACSNPRCEQFRKLIEVEHPIMPTRDLGVLVCEACRGSGCTDNYYTVPCTECTDGLERKIL